MSTVASRPELASLKRAAAEAAVELVENDMVVGLGSGSTAALSSLLDSR
jgi:ribose 5-phosphate isomerase